MSTIKARKQGNSIMVTIPSSFGVKEGEEFFFIKKDNGAIVMIPKINNPFEIAEDGEFYTPDLNVGFVPVKGELDEL
ncbi:type II toxin-antitoxin system PemI/MazE family antitoxin [Carnobacterium funditum]|uniref:type II toxin-antitoxin system PemI/MazE family antitoxin n=1 Tax=Carnobacterium funditum TaxID=2752 RepID=UPI00054FCB9B|nr:AbrB family transcriptional regulator [Carnobacterium funditum]